jgi:membrane protein
LTHFHSALFSAAGWQGVVVQVLQILASVSIVAGITTVIFRYVPDTRVGWKNALIGGVLTSVVFNAGNVGVGLYLARAAVTAAYGAAGSVVVVLLWLYFSAHMLLVGAEFTQVYSQRYGRGLSPAEDRELRRIDRDRGNAVHA